MASREWGSSASDSGSSLRQRSPGSLARRVLPGLFLCHALLLPVPAASAGQAVARRPEARAEAAGPQQPPEDAMPPGGSETDGGPTGNQEGEAFPDTTLFIPPALGPRPAPGDTGLAARDTSGVRIDTSGVRVDTTGARADTAGAARPAVGLPRGELPTPEAGSPAPGQLPGPRTKAKPAARRGIFGLHPAVIILGLVVAHVFLIRLITK